MLKELSKLTWFYDISIQPRTFKGCSIKKLGDGQLSSSSESLLDPDKPKSPETPGKRVISKQGSVDKDTVKVFTCVAVMALCFLVPWGVFAFTRSTLIFNGRVPHWKPNYK